MKKYINTSNYYLSTTTSKIENETSKNGYFDVADITIDGATLPFNGYYWVDVDFGDIDKREIFRIYKREGYRLFYDDRISPNGTSAHIAGASVGLRDFSQLLNSLSTNTDNFGEVEKVGDLSIIVRGGVIYDVNNMNAKDGKITLEDTPFDSSYITTNSELYIVLEYDEVDGWDFVIKTELLLTGEGQYPIAKIVVGNNAISEIIDLRGTIINQGNMHKSIYDKHGVNDDAFEMDNMIQSVDGLHMFVTQSQIDLWNSYDEAKQDLLVSGTNIKTINNTSLLGTGDIDTNQVSNDTYSDNWNGVNNIAPSKNAVYNKLESINNTVQGLSSSMSNKQNKLTAGQNIQINGDTISATDTKYTAGQNIQINGDIISATDTKYTAGQNIQINGNTISATDTKYTAGTGLSLNNTTLNNTGVLSVNSQNGNVTVSEFTPSNTGTTGQVLKKTSNGYKWSVEADAVTSVNGQTGAVTVNEFTPGNQGDTGQVLKKTSSGYSWQNESGGGGGGGDYTAGAGINISSQNEISNIGVLSVNNQTGNVTVQPVLTPGTGIDITNNVISATGGGGEGNTKTFYLSSVGTGDLTTAQAVVDWYLAGKNPIIVYTNKAFVVDSYFGNSLSFKCFTFSFSNSNPSYNEQSYTITTIRTMDIAINESTGTATRVNYSSGQTMGKGYLAPGVNYSTPYLPEYDGSPATKKYVDNSVKTYYPGEGISIVSGWGDLLGWYIPSIGEIDLLSAILLDGGVTSPDAQADLLKLPKCGRRSPSGSPSGLTGWSYWTSTNDFNNVGYAYYMAMNASSTLYTDTAKKSVACPIRLFKNDIVKPTSYDKELWEELLTINGQTYSGKIYRNREKGLITFDIKDSSNYDMSFTIADKNVGATKVWNNGDALTPRNCGNVFQWGNSYGFPSAINENAVFNTSSTQVDTSDYGWMSDIYHNYSGKSYFGDTFITGNDDRSSTDNVYLWANNTIGIHPENTINNTIEESNTKTFYISDTSDLDTAQAVVDRYNAGKNPIVVYGTEKPIYTVYDTSNGLRFRSSDDKKSGTTTSTMINYWKMLSLVVSNGTVTSISTGDYTGNAINVLSTGTNYSTPYNPKYPGSPATKKYVDDNVSGSIKYEDFETSTTVGATLTISYFTTQITPSANFTLVAGTVKEGMQYIVRVNSGATAYTMSLGTGVTNPFGEDLTLTASKTTTVVLLATSSSTLEIFSIRTAA